MTDLVPSLLEVCALTTGYGKKLVVNDVSLNITAGEIVALIGHNGAGKSTLLKAIFGVLPIWHGHLTLDGRNVATPSPRELLELGVVYVPQGNRVFSGLTVRENLEIGEGMLTNRHHLRSGIERALATFPDLAPRLRQQAGTLSGGEKQMLALANALILSPQLLLLDEPSLGLAPFLASRTLAHIEQISKLNMTAILLVEQRVREALKIAHRVYVLRNGQIGFAGLSHDLRDDDRLQEVFL